jgi:hypothetical protein
VYFTVPKIQKRIESEPDDHDDDGQEFSSIFTYVILCFYYCYRCNSSAGGISGSIEFTCNCIEQMGDC